MSMYMFVFLYVYVWRSLWIYACMYERDERVKWSLIVLSLFTWQQTLASLWTIKIWILIIPRSENKTAKNHVQCMTELVSFHGWWMSKLLQGCICLSLPEFLLNEMKYSHYMYYAFTPMKNVIGSKVNPYLLQFWV